MATETDDYAAAARFLRERVQAEQGADTSAAALPTLLAGEPGPGCRVFTSGWNELAGVMILAPETHYDAALRVSLAATHERALRDLLLALPPGQPLLVLAVGAWTQPALAEILEGQAVPLPEAAAAGVQAYLGIKRGSGRLAAVDPEAFRHGRRGPAARPSGLPAEETVAAGKKDPVLVEFRDLGSLKGRLGQSRFVAEGPLLVDRAVRDGLPVLQILFTPGFAARPEGADLLRRALGAGIPCCRVSEGLMGSVTTTRPVPVVAAAIFTAIRDAAQLHLTERSALLIVDGVGNPNNLGMVLRTADAAGVEAVVLIGEGASPFHKECVRASRGAVGRLPLFGSADAEAFLRGLAARGFHILGATARAAHDLYAATIERPAAFVIGNETEGIREEILALCTDRVRIPMAPGQSSLNVGVAAGILLYELVRRQRERNGSA
ncbi:MAG: RNA methyltransferase [Armatimonadetes bacterium]|nr:RNA methyltransferase [Armatimonadota bacterium]